MALRAEKIDLERIYTPKEFEALPEFGELYELVDGKLVKKPMPGDDHGTIIDNLMFELRKFDPNRLVGKAWSQTTVDMGQGWMPLPDVAYMVANRVPARSEKSVRGIPDLVVEVHSPSDLDSTAGRDDAAEKIKKYQAFGVKIIWAINPRSRTVEVYHLGQSAPVKSLSIGEELDGEVVIKGFKLPVSKLFE